MSIGALSTLFESAPGAILDNDGLVRVCGSDLNALLAARWLRELRPAAEVICTSCGEPHLVSVEHNELCGALGAHCADGAAWIAVDPERLRRFTFEHEHFVAALSKALGLNGKPEALVDGVCWLIGFPAIAGAQVAVVAAREMNDPRRVLEIAGVLNTRFKKWKGAVLCGARPMVDVGLLPRQLKPIELVDLALKTAKGAIAIDLDVIAMALGLTRRARGEHGAPTIHPKLTPIIDERIRAGAAPSSVSEEVRCLLADARSWATAGQQLPEFDAMRMIVTRRRRLLG